MIDKTYYELHNELKAQYIELQSSEFYWKKAFEGEKAKHDELLRQMLSPVVSTLEKFKANVCSKAVRTFGHSIQVFVAAEEMGELIQAISKDLRGQGDQKNIMEEIADVDIMLTQLKLIYGFDKGQFEEVIFAKLSKLANKLENK